MTNIEDRNARSSSLLVVEHDSGMLPREEQAIATATTQTRSLNVQIVFAGVDEAANKKGEGTQT